MHAASLSSVYYIFGACHIVADIIHYYETLDTLRVVTKGNKSLRRVGISWMLCLLRIEYLRIIRQPFLKNVITVVANRCHFVQTTVKHEMYWAFCYYETLFIFGKSLSTLIERVLCRQSFIHCKVCKLQSTCQAAF